MVSAYLTAYSGKVFLCVADGDFQKWELSPEVVARLSVEAAEHTARHVRGLYVPRYGQNAAPLEANDDAPECPPLANPEE